MDSSGLSSVDTSLLDAGLPRDIVRPRFGRVRLKGSAKYYIRLQLPVIMRIVPATTASAFSTPVKADVPDKPGSSIRRSQRAMSEAAAFTVVTYVFPQCMPPTKAATGLSFGARYFV